MVLVGSLDQDIWNNEGKHKLNSKKTISRDNVTHGELHERYLRKSKFGNANRINSGNFNATTVKLADKFDFPYAHLYILDHIIAQDQFVDAVTVTSSKY